MQALRAFYKENKTLLNRIAISLLTILSLYIFVEFLLIYLAPFILGLVISIIVEPFVTVLTKRLRLSRGVAAGICLLLVFLLFGGLLATLITKLVVEARALIVDLPSLTKDFYAMIDRFEKKVLFDILPDNLSVSISDPKFISDFASIAASNIGNNSLSVFSSIPSGLMMFLISIIASFFFIKDKEIVFNALHHLVPKSLHTHVRTVRTGVFRAIGGYFKAQGILMCISAIICITGLTVIRFEYSLFVGLGIAVIDALPIFGSGFVFWPWAAYNFITGNYPMAIALLIIYGVVFITRQFLEPRILGHQIGLHPLITLMSIYVGLRLIGFWGLLLGPSVAIVLKAMFEASDQAAAVEVRKSGSS